MADAPIETPTESGDGSKGLVSYWKMEINLATKAEKDWRKRAWKAVDRYRDEKRRVGKRFNIYWANVETLKPAIYSQTPVPDVRRRYLDQDPTGREAAEIIERSLIFSIDDYDFDGTMEAVRDDMLIPGRGLARVRYDAEIITRRPEDVSGFNPDTGEEVKMFFLDGAQVEPQFDPDGTPFMEDIGNQEAYCEYVFWEDVRLFPAKVRRWEDVYGVGFRHLMTRDELVDQFGELGKNTPLNHAVLDVDDKPSDDASLAPLKKAVVWEIWDKRKLRRLWIAEGFDDLLDKEDDPLGLDGFFPIPKPLYAVNTTDTMVPSPELFQYRDQIDELDDVTSRIQKLIKALKVRGVYAAVIKEIGDLLSGDDNELFPASDWAAMTAKGGLDGAITWMPIEQIAKVLVGLREHREQLKQEIFEVTGISDIVRGSTKANETFGAQRLKASFGSVRMTPRQKPMERFARDILRLKAEIIAEHFTKENISRMTGIDVSDEVMKLLRDEKTRSFRIDVETESTIQPDAEREKEQAVEFTTGITQFLGAASELGGQQPAMVPLLMELLKFSVRRFKTGRTLEEAIDRTAQNLEQIAQQPQQSDGQAEQAAQEMEIKKETAQTDMQIKVSQMQFDKRLKELEQEFEKLLALRQQDIDASLTARRDALNAGGGGSQA